MGRAGEARTAGPAGDAIAPAAARLRFAAVNIAHLRTEYRRASLDEADVDADPYRQFARWFGEAVKAELPEPNAMTLATVGTDGRPGARIVLLKGFDERGFVFFTNYDSRKGHELAARPHAALLFHWTELERQVRIEGVAGKVDAAESDDYFASRPRASRLGAWASPQSEPVPDRAALEARFAAIEAQYRDAAAAVPRPAHWGGYRVVPEALEFWQGRRSRMHDRVRYRRDTATGGWTIDRLAP
jgi:pyridoxamine 5'-phosphate oxidase